MSQRDRSIWQCPLLLPIPVSGEATIAWLPWDCLGICVTLTKERGAAPLPPHTWMAPVVEDMLQHGRTGLTKVVVMGPGMSLLFYERQSPGEGLSLGKVRDATFILMGAGTWVGKLAHLSTDPLPIWEGWQVIAQAITECHIGVRGPGHPCSRLTTPQPFWFYHGYQSPREKHIKDAGFEHWPPLHKPSWGRDHEQWQRNPRLLLPQFPSPSQDHGFESDRSSVLTASSVSLQSDRSEDSWHPHHGRCCREPGGHIKINLPIFEDEDAITYQCWRWDWIVYCQTWML